MSLFVSYVIVIIVLFKLDRMEKNGKISHKSLMLSFCVAILYLLIGLVYQVQTLI